MKDLLVVPLGHVLTLAALSLAETLQKGLLGGFTPCSAPAEGGFARGKASLATVGWVVFPQMGKNVLVLALSVRWSLGCFLDSRENNSCLSLIAEE